MEEAVERLTLAGITIYSLSAEQTEEARISAPQPEEGDLNIGTQFRVAPEGVDYRCHLSLHMEGRNLGVDGAISYRSDEPLELTPEIIAEYGTSVAIMALYPYLRQNLADLAMRLGFQLTLPMLRVGEIEVKAPA